MRKSTVIFTLMVIFALYRALVLCSYDLLSCSERLSKAKFTAPAEEASTGFIADFRRNSSDNIRRYLPSPHSELLLGMTIGVNDLKTVPKFNNASKITGTVHVVVVSGYNIALVFGLVIAVIGSQYRMRNLLFALLVTLVYAVISGFEPPVIRSWIMGSIAAWGKYYGRSLDGAKLLFFSGLCMVLYDPAFLFSLSFQLSFMATLSLCLFSDPIALLVRKFSRGRRFLLLEDLTSTLSAQVLVWPLISNTFGTVSVISPIANPLVLWTVPISTVLGMVMLFLTFISAFLSHLFAWIVFVPLDIYVQTVNWLGGLGGASVTFGLNNRLMLIYYIVIFFWRLCLYRS